MALLYPFLWLSSIFYIYVYIYSIVYMHHIFSIRSAVDGHLGCFHVLVIVNTATMNTRVYASLNYSFQFSSVDQSCPAFCDSINCIIVLNLSF